MTLAKPKDTALDTSQRTDYRGRHIRNMVVWRCKENEEKEVRGLAVLALEDPAKLTKAVDEAVTRDDQSPSGFTVDWERLSSIRGGPIAQGHVRQASDTCHVARNSEERRADLAKELKAGPVPLRDGPLVIVTGNVGPDRLDDKGVWRGLTSLVPSEDWVAPEKKRHSGTERYRGTSGSS
ncbi:MAG: hypothetical protein K8U57_21100 [Planctomycetes bacterium]|nr:hypothetical protein [Planctomycetota bacterium]